MNKIMRYVCLGLAILGGLLFAGDILIAILALTFVGSHSSSIGIIGGADGPTSVFVATTVGRSMAWDLLVYALLVVVGIAGYRFFRKRDKV